MIKEKWQQELNELTLSETKKLRMKHSIKEGKQVKKADGVYRLTLLSFIIVAIFSAYLIIGDNMNNSTVHVASSPPVETDHTGLFHQLTIYFGAIFILMWIVTYVSYLVFVKTKRWQQPWVVKWREKLLQTHKGSFIAIPIILIIVLNFLVYLTIPVMVLKGCIAVLLLLLHALILLYLARDAKGHYSCPHCQHTYSKQESRKLWRTSLKPLICPSCGRQVYLSKKSQKLSGITNVLNVIIIMVIFNIGLPFLITVICIVCYGLFIVQKLAPLLLELEESEQFLW